MLQTVVQSAIGFARDWVDKLATSLSVWQANDAMAAVCLCCGVSSCKHKAPFGPGVELLAVLLRQAKKVIQSTRPTLSLISRIYDAHSLQCIDPRDRMDALSDLSRRHAVSESIKPNYAKPVELIWQEMVERYLAHGIAKPLLHCERAPSRPSRTKLPSWVRGFISVRPVNTYASPANPGRIVRCVANVTRHSRLEILGIPVGEIG